MEVPLNNMRILVPRAAGKGDALAAQLAQLGAVPLLRPLIAHAPPEDLHALDAALARLCAGVYHWLLLTSATTVEQIAPRLPAALPPTLKIAAVGPATAAACSQLLQRTPDALPERFLAADLPAALGELAGVPLLLPNAAIADPALEQALRTAGAQLDRVIAYRTIPAPDADLLSLLAHGIDAILFTSGSTVRAFATLIDPADLRRQPCIIACIGPSTAAVCREYQIEPTVVAEVSTTAGLVEALAGYVQSNVVTNKC
jgi:uroporphyrinogen-III synthase